MKKFLVVLCTVAMVAGLATSAFADGSIGGPLDPANQNPAGLGGSSAPAVQAPSTGGGQAVAGTGSTAGASTTTSDGAAAASSSTSTSGGSTGAAATGGGAAAAADTKADYADPAKYTDESLAAILVRMLNTSDSVHNTAEVVEAMNIAGEDEKTIDGAAVDTSKFTIISKALDSDSKGVAFEENEEGFAVALSGNEMTKGREAEDLFVIAAPKDPEVKKAYVASVELDSDVLKIQIPEDCAVCITLLQ